MRIAALLALLAAGLALAAGETRLEDHFNRTPEEGGKYQATIGWEDDARWAIARYRGLDDPGKAGLQVPETENPLPNPWRLSFYPAPGRSANGFWWLYRGTGPSWCVSTIAQPDWARYRVQAAVKPARDSEVGLIAAYRDNRNFLLFRWKQAGAELVSVVDGTERAIAADPRGFEPAQWYTLRVDLDEGTAAVLIDGAPLLRADNPGAASGRLGLYASCPEVAPAAPGGPRSLPTLIYFDDVLVMPIGEEPPTLSRVRISGEFPLNRYCAAWATSASEWWPADLKGLKLPPAEYGAATPIATDQPGLFWHKGAHYRDLRITIPADAGLFDGQTLHLTDNYRPDAGYRTVLRPDRITLLRGEAEVGAYPIAPTKRGRLIVERKAGELILTSETLDPDAAVATVVARREIGRYRDPAPLPAPMVGFTVTIPRLPAADVLVETDGLQDAFNEAPVAWAAGYGVWSVRGDSSLGDYTVFRQWMYGEGEKTPTLWSKSRLDGDQVVEAFTAPRYSKFDVGENGRYPIRDTLCDANLSVCADGTRPESGYTLMRATSVDGKRVTRLARNGIVIWESTDPAHLLSTMPGSARLWACTRLEKRGGETMVFLDNRLATTYVDPDPLPGGRVAIWTTGNAIVVARANLFAERMTLGAPHAGVPAPAP